MIPHTPKHTSNKGAGRSREFTGEMVRSSGAAAQGDATNAPRTTTDLFSLNGCRAVSHSSHDDPTWLSLVGVVLVVALFAAGALLA